MKDIFKTYELISDSCIEATNNLKFFNINDALDQVKEDFINKDYSTWDLAGLTDHSLLYFTQIQEPNGQYNIDSIAVIVLHNETQNSLQYYDLKKKI